MEKEIKVLWLGINPGHLKEFGQSMYFVDADLKNEQPDLAIVVDWTPKDKTKLKELRRLGIPSILVAQEPSVVIPKHLSKKLRRLFRYTITVGRAGGDDWIKWPQLWQARRREEHRRLDRGVLINADKYSAVCGELYSLRRVVVTKEARIDLFGGGWGDSIIRRTRRWVSAILFAVVSGGRLKLNSGVAVTKTPLNYLGPAENKLVTLEKYRYSVVIENSQEYLSEKLFDCFFAGTIPIYVGADLEALGIPKKLVIEAKPDLKSIQSAIQFAATVDLKKYQDEVGRWLSEPQVVGQWSAESVFEDLFGKLRSWYQKYETSARLLKSEPEARPKPKI